MSDPDPQQVTDFNPGIEPSGLFWTVALPNPTASADVARGTAIYSLKNYVTRDYHDFFNTVNNGPYDPAKVTFTVRWLGNGSSYNLDRSDYQRVRGSFISGDAVISYEALNKATGITYRSDSGPQQTVFAAVGTESNGSFYPG